MRLGKRNLTARVNSNLRIQFGTESLSSYAGLELISRFLRKIQFSNQLRAAFACVPLKGDYTIVQMMTLLVGMLLVGARRLRHVRLLGNDPMLLRFCGLQRLPDERTLSRWLRQFAGPRLKTLARFNLGFAAGLIRRLKILSVVLDLDGSVVVAGKEVEWAFRGYNNKKRRLPSYYPLLLHVGALSLILGVKNRPGNIHDSRGAVDFLRDTLRQVSRLLDPRTTFHFRADGAFFQRSVITFLQNAGCLFTIRVPMHRWLGLKQIIQMRTRWTPINDRIDFFQTHLWVEAWKMELEVTVYRKKIDHPSPRNYQLDLFSPDDPYYEYSAVTTNSRMTGRDLWDFMAGRGAQEKTLAELKSGLAFDTIPSRHYAANSAWQQIVVLAHNLLRAFQVETGAVRRTNPKSTTSYVFPSIQTVRFLLLNIAGRIVRTDRGPVLRLSRNFGHEVLYQQVARHLPRTA